jgi:hypothetical protein
MFAMLIHEEDVVCTAEELYVCCVARLAVGRTGEFRSQFVMHVCHVNT